MSGRVYKRAFRASSTPAGEARPLPVQCSVWSTGKSPDSRRCDVKNTRRTRSGSERLLPAGLHWNWAKSSGRRPPRARLGSLSHRAALSEPPNVSEAIWYSRAKRAIRSDSSGVSRSRFRGVVPRALGKDRVDVRRGQVNVPEKILDHARGKTFLDCLDQVKFAVDATAEHCIATKQSCCIRRGHGNSRGCKIAGNVRQTCRRGNRKPLIQIRTGARHDRVGEHVGIQQAHDCLVLSPSANPVRRRDLRSPRPSPAGGRARNPAP